MGKCALLIHGMWGTSEVWRNWRVFLETRGWAVLTPSLRHHEAPPLTPPPELGTTGLADYARDLEILLQGLPEKPVIVGHSMGGLIALKLCARGLARAGVLLTPAPPSSVLALRISNVLAFARIERQWGWWRKPHRATLKEAVWHTFNTMDPCEAAGLHGTFVHDSGRALLEMGLPWLDRTASAHVAPADVAVPLLMVAGLRDRLTPPSVVRRIADRFDGAEYREYPGQGHWVLGQPGWQEIAADAAQWMDRQWQSSTSPN
jgi:pimeloyl-ACP methyl ester carboxylesterase